MDAVVDEDSMLTSISLRNLKIHDRILPFYLDPIEAALAYQPNISFPWKENINLERFNFGFNEILNGTSRLIDILSYFLNLKYLNLSCVPLQSNCEVSIIIGFNNINRN